MEVDKLIASGNLIDYTLNKIIIFFNKISLGCKSTDEAKLKGKFE